MASLDVSDAFDASFLDTIIVIRRVQTISKYGRQISAERAMSSVGVVVPSSPDDLVRVPEGQYTNKAITIYTKAIRLQGSSPGVNADKVIWHGSEYVVSALLDYSQYGVGFVAAVCISMDAQDPPPMPEPIGHA